MHKYYAQYEDRLDVSVQRDQQIYWMFDLTDI